MKIDLDRYMKKSNVKSERAILLGEFLERLNADVKPPYKPMTSSRLGMMLQFTKTKELYKFLAECKESKNFSKFFWWRMKQ